ncbi:FeoC-like transcriptional regulator [Immundisolibacter sp.]|uniref:FeoC-like transcriptional regulator n=1 Tax=Immundisolibacter sp. TaxID=1934948 RepID=UPI002634AF19|nr:FeoC-like transcriptional regulator [Immundisolibacter sp.]MDD3650042.1 FeoC-like transcriptional regulator [Immundisolibacter sp.]
MLRRLLQQVAQAGTTCSAELARALGVSTELVELMLDDLARRGYLRPLTPGRAARCGRCPAHTACLYRNQARTWALAADRRQHDNGAADGKTCLHHWRKRAQRICQRA